MYAGSEVETNTIDSNFRQYTIVFNGSSSSARRDKSAYLSDDAGTNTMNGITLGRRNTDTGYGDPDIGEILIYEGALDNSVRDSIEDYLATKWGL